MASPWPEGFQRVPDEDWTRDPIDELARAYDTVEQHGWYDNLDPTADAIIDALPEGGVLVDYSGGTGILVDRLFERGLEDAGVLNVDSSPKFLRLCLEKHREDERVAMRRLPYLDEESRLAYPDEVIDEELVGQIDVLSSTNAIHLYYNLDETLASWRRLLKPEGIAFVQSGNVDRDGRPGERRIIDQTVAAVDQAARRIVREEDEWKAYREAVDDEAHMEDHEELQGRFFLPAKEADHYERRFREAGFAIRGRDHRSIPVETEEWAQFLKVYHQGVLGWVGGAEKVTGEAARPAVVEDRKRLIDRGLADVLDDAETFEAEWTYWTLEPA